jgi:hypothetical protein
VSLLTGRPLIGFSHKDAWRTYQRLTTTGDTAMVVAYISLHWGASQLIQFNIIINNNYRYTESVMQRKQQLFGGRHYALSLSTLW